MWNRRKADLRDIGSRLSRNSLGLVRTSHGLAAEEETVMRAKCALLWRIAISVLMIAMVARADTIYESFENGFGPWRPSIGNPPVAWRVSPSQDQAYDGQWSLDFTADGTNDDGQVFMVREIQLPAGTWNIGLEFHLWSNGDNQITSWWGDGFIGPYEPTQESDFTQSAYGERIKPITLGGWDSFSMQRTITTTTATTIYIAFGYDIVWETQRTHYFDSVTLTGVPIQCGNGVCFAGEDACNCPDDCAPAPASELTCDDGKDDDCDGFTDCADTDCSMAIECLGIICDGDLICETGENGCDCPSDCGPAPLHESNCDNGQDEDCDGLIDCDDFVDCGFNPVCMGTGNCGNGTCDDGEDCSTCPLDCPQGSGASCGNGVCEAGNGEDCVSCPQDCNGVQGGKPSKRFCCGDGDGNNPVGCGDLRCSADGNSCLTEPAVSSCCGDYICEGDENSYSCEIDCGSPPACGDGNCDPDEDECSCPADCGSAPANETLCADGEDNDCDGLKDCDDSDCANDPTCSSSCLAVGEACSASSECCSNRCHRGKCK